ncbi:MAG: hypothetical protein J5613_04705, partial [Alphaproteobacteria bacterium]|nr:hypothetical protein [Alphaproteobacteria bacterium]
MKFIGYTSIICLSALCVAHDANAVNMTSQIQRLVREKQEKVSKLEECDGKRKGFMIAGISTIGLTAVGVGVNIAQASKSNKLTEQIEEKNLELEKQQAKVVEINSEIARRNAAQKRMACESDGTHVYVNGVCRDRVQYECEQLGRMWVNGECKDKPITQNTTSAPIQTNNDAAILGCIKEIEQILVFGFDAGKPALYTHDGYMIPGDKAVQISPNWDYSKFTVNLDVMRSTVSYNSANGVQEHERDACETLNRLKNYLSTVDRSTLKHVEDLGAAEYLSQIRDNNAGAGNGNTPADQPVYYRSMNELTAALDEECRNSGGTGRDSDGDCICPDKMTQTENKRQCTCLDPTATYNKQQGKCVPGTINVTPIAAKPLSSSGDGGLHSSSLSQSGSAPNAYTPDWTILDDNQNSYGLTQERFCNNGGETGHVGGALMPAYRDERTLTLEIKNAAGYHYWCDKLGGNWGVNQTSYGREWFCNIDKSKCTQGSTPQQSNNTVNRDGHANTLLAESILEQECSSVEKQSMPLVFEYYCVGTTQRKCEKLKTAFEDAGLPAPDVEFKAKIEEQ